MSRRPDGLLNHNVLDDDKGPQDACGVFGVWAPGEEVAKLTFYGLYALQHRGQESAGIATSDGERILVYKDMGLTTGLTIGTAATQKLGFYNATPVAQQATTGTTTGFTANSGTTVRDDSTFTGGSGTKAYRVSDIVLALKNLGLLAAS